MPFKNKETQKKYNKEYHKKYYELNKQYYFDKARQHQVRKREWFQNLKKNLKCIKCGEKTPICLDFHHRDSSQKLRCVTKMVMDSCSKERILAEIEKCDVLCANCHRKLGTKQFCNKG